MIGPMSKGFDNLETPAFGPQTIHRGLALALQNAVRRTPVTAIVGPRQSGKSTLAEELLLAEGDWTSVTFDDPMALGFAKRDPDSFLTQHQPPLIIDEVQRLPELILPLKKQVDHNRRPGSYVLTGSANIFDQPEVADSLAGRVEQIELLPLTQAEIEGSQDENFLDLAFERTLSSKGKSDDPLVLPRIIRGGFPEPVMRQSAEDRRAWHESYIRAMLDRDVRDQARLAGISELPRLLRLVAAKSSDLLNTAGLARDSGMKETTLHRYWDILKRLYLIQEVPAFRLDLTMRLIKAPKAYLSDTGTAVWMLGRQSFNREQDEFLLQPLFEAFAANEFARLAACSNSKPRLYHFRTVRQHAADFVLEYPDGSIIGVNAAMGTSPGTKGFTGLSFLQEYANAGFRAGIILYEGTQVQPLAKDIWAVPYSALWTPSGFFLP